MSSNDPLYLGEKASYWLALKQRAEELDLVNLIREIADLHARVTFYEDRIKQMALLMNHKNE